MSPRAVGITKALGLSVTCVGVGLLVSLGSGPLLDVAVRWPLLLLCGGLATTVLVQAARKGRLVEPLPLIALVVLIAFVVRPLQLSLQLDGVVGGYTPAAWDGQGGASLQSQEITLFAERKSVEPFETSLTRAVALCLLFITLILVGYRSAAGRSGAAWLARCGRAHDAKDLRPAVGLLLVIGLAGQVMTYAAAGGVSDVLNGSFEQTGLEVSFTLVVLSSCAVTALVIWFAWHRPSSTPARWAFMLILGEVTLFHASLGSRARAVLPFFVLAVMRHYKVSPWTQKQLAVAFVTVLVVLGAYASVREAVYRDGFWAAASNPGSYVVAPAEWLNDNSAFDGLLQATSLVGPVLPYEYGRSLLEALETLIPSPLHPSKPVGGDVQFREAVWGATFEGGRPYTVVGEFYTDFGWPGVAFGALVLGAALRALGGLVRDGGDRHGRPFRVALFAIGMLVSYELFIGVYSLALAFAVQLLAPFVFAVYALARRPSAAPAPTHRPAALSSPKGRSAW